MAVVNELYNTLKTLLKLLQEEKEALLHNDAIKVAEIVDKKNEIIEKLTQIRDNETSPHPSDVIPTEMAVNCTPELIPTEYTKVGGSPLLDMVQEINTLQETNLLLTKQSLSFQNILLESIAKNLQSMSNTYSSKGSYEKTNNIGLIDQKG